MNIILRVRSVFYNCFSFTKSEHIIINYYKIVNFNVYVCIIIIKKKKVDCPFSDRAKLMRKKRIRQSDISLGSEKSSS